jgi:hypothetical protein
MQLGKIPARYSGIDKPKLFAIISALVVTILAVPVILPHITHPSMIYHIMLHLGSLVVTIFLSIVSFLAYSRRGSFRILLMTLGFISLVVVESLSLLSATGNIGLLEIPLINAELSHVFLLVMVTLFGLGVLRGEASNENK